MERALEYMASTLFVLNTAMSFGTLKRWQNRWEEEQLCMAEEDMMRALLSRNKRSGGKGCNASVLIELSAALDQQQEEE